MEERINMLIQFVAKHHVFDENKYPELKDATPDEIVRFAIKHSALHFSKAAGKVATVSESVDHGGDIDAEELKKNISKTIVNALRLAEVIGMTGEDIIQRIEKQYSDKLE
mgnify:CR=1 FL=1